MKLFVRSKGKTLEKWNVMCSNSLDPLVLVTNVLFVCFTICSQVGTVKNTRFVTVTSTIEKSLVEPTQSINPSEPLSENILATSTANAYDKEPPLDSSIVTLPPIGLAGK